MQEEKKAKQDKRYKKKFRLTDIGINKDENANKNWLPNFGSVWQNNARGKSRIDFLSEMSNYKPPPRKDNSKISDGNNDEEYDEKETGRNAGSKEINTEFGDLIRQDNLGNTAFQQNTILSQQKDMLRKKFKQQQLQKKK